MGYGHGPAEKDQLWSGGYAIFMAWKYHRKGGKLKGIVLDMINDVHYIEHCSLQSHARSIFLFS